MAVHFCPLWINIYKHPPVALPTPRTNSKPFPTLTRISAHLPYTGPHILTNLMRHAIMGCKVVLFPRTISLPLGIERHLRKGKIEPEESKLHEQTKLFELSST